MSQGLANPATAAPPDAVTPGVSDVSPDVATDVRHDATRDATRDAGASAQRPTPAPQTVPALSADRQLLSDEEWQALLWPAPEVPAAPPSGCAAQAQSQSQTCPAGARP